MVGDKCLGLVEAIREVFLDTEYQRCIVHFMRNVFCNVPRTRGKEIGAKLKAIFAQEDREACLRKAEEVAQFLRDNKMKTAASTLESGIQEALTYTNYPHEHWLKIRSKLYQTRNNRNYCKERGIRLSGPALGRKSKAAKEENEAQMYQDACDRNVIEGNNGTAKRRYGLSRIMSKLDETSKTEAGFSILMMNAWKRVYQELLRTFLHLLFFNNSMCSALTV